MMDLVFVYRIGTASESLGFIHTKRKGKRKQSILNDNQFRLIQNRNESTNCIETRGGYSVFQKKGAPTL